MNNATQTAIERKTREFWSCFEGQVQQVTGYECETEPRVWWVPALGYSLWRSQDLFETEREAVDCCVADLEAKHAKLGVDLHEMKVRQHQLTASNRGR